MFNGFIDVLKELSNAERIPYKAVPLSLSNINSAIAEQKIAALVDVSNRIETSDHAISMDEAEKKRFVLL